MNCWGCLSDVAGADFCPGCGKLQPLASGERDYFRALDLPKPSLSIDAAKLEETFHAKSRLFHPDRFQRKDPKELSISLERSAVLNEAYRTLRDPRSRARYLLSARGGGLAASKETPPELAELYFDLEESASDLGRLHELSGELARRQAALEARFARLSEDYDREGEKVLPELRSVLDQENYLSSMRRELGRRLAEGESR